MGASMSITDITAFLGWVTVINFSVLIFSTVMILAFQNKFAALHAKMFGFAAEDIKRAYFDYLARYKILVICFNLAPYIALKIMY